MATGTRCVVLADPIDRAAMEQLRSAPCAVVDASSGAEALAAALPQAWALIVRSRTKVTADLIARAPRLELIARTGVGVDSIDMAAAQARGIRVVNAPAAATISVAELTVAFALLLVRGFYASVVRTKAGEWVRSTQGAELAGRVVGFVGYGRIARESAKRFVPFGVSTIAFDPFVTETGDTTRLVAFDALLAGADIVSLHAALTPQNRHLIDVAALARMKAGAFLINVARGPLVDEEALLAALASGHLAGAALDVYEVEPPINRALLAHPNVIATPHIGASTPEGQSRAGQAAVAEVLRALRGEPLTAQVVVPGERS